MHKLPHARCAIATTPVVDIATYPNPRRAVRIVIVALDGVSRDNQQIADELVMSVETVKSTLKHLFAKFDLSSAPRGDKRLRLAEIALRSDLSSSD